VAAIEVNPVSSAKFIPNSIVVFGPNQSQTAMPALCTSAACE